MQIAPPLNTPLTSDPLMLFVTGEVQRFVLKGIIQPFSDLLLKPAIGNVNIRDK